MSLARYDASYDLRDRARLLKNALLSPLCQAALHTSKPVPRLETLGERGREWTLGSMAQVIMRDTQGQLTLPEWESEVPSKGVRDPLEPSQTTTAVISRPAVVVPSQQEKKEKKVWKNLEKFYASESDSDEEESEEETEEEDENESEGNEGEESEEEDDEDEINSEGSSHERQSTHLWRQ